MVIENKKQLSSCKPIIEEENSWKQSYDCVIIDNSTKKLDLGVFSVKFDVSEDSPEVKKLLKVLTAEKTKKTRITIDNVEELLLDNMGSGPKNILIKCTSKKKPYQPLSTC